MRRIEAASKINGTARFGIDALPDGLIYASVVMCPTLGGTVAHFDASPAKTMPGFIKAFSRERPTPVAAAASRSSPTTRFAR